MFGASWRNSFVGGWCTQGLNEPHSGPWPRSRDLKTGQLSRTLMCRISLLHSVLVRKAAKDSQVGTVKGREVTTSIQQHFQEMEGCEGRMYVNDQERNFVFRMNSFKRKRWGKRRDVWKVKVRKFRKEVSVVFTENQPGCDQWLMDYNE